MLPCFRSIHLAALIGLAAAAPAAAASVVYTFSETGAFFGDASFTYTAPTFFTGPQDFTPQLCAVTPNAQTTATNTCAPTQRAEPVPTSFNVNADYIGFNYSDGGGGNGTGFFFFTPHAFRANGVYLTTPPSNACTPGHGCVGSAGERTLTVSGIVGGTVPEPAAWALMVAGFGLVGVTARRRDGVAVAA